MQVGIYNEKLEKIYSVENDKLINPQFWYNGIYFHTIALAVTWGALYSGVIGAQIFKYNITGSLGSKAEIQAQTIVDSAVKAGASFVIITRADRSHVKVIHNNKPEDYDTIGTALKKHNIKFMRYYMVDDGMIDKLATGV